MTMYCNILPIQQALSQIPYKPHNSHNFDLHHYDPTKNKMRDRLRSLCIFLNKQVMHEERYLMAEISKVEIQISINGADPVLIKQLSNLN